MSPEEALSLYNFKQEEPLDEQLEFVFFELKQKIYRQLDQVLLYPKWVKELTRLSTASLALAHPLPIDPIPSIFDNLAPNKNTTILNMVAQFNWQQQYRSQVALLIYNGHSPSLLIDLLNLWQAQQEGFLQYWSAANIPTQDILLSKQFDPQQLLVLLNDLENKGVLSLQDLQEETTPPLLQQFISWNKAVWHKLKRA
jgi:hypothetical protein